MKLYQLIIIIIILLWISINSVIIYFIIDANENALDKKIFSDEKVIQFVGTRKVCDLYHNQTILDISAQSYSCIKNINHYIVRVDNILPEIEKWITISECLSNIPVKGLQIFASENGNFFPCEFGIIIGVIIYGILGGSLSIFLFCNSCCFLLEKRQSDDKESLTSV